MVFPDGTPKIFPDLSALSVAQCPAGFTVNVETTKTGNVWAYVVSEARRRLDCTHGSTEAEGYGSSDFMETSGSFLSTFHCGQGVKLQVGEL